MDIEEFLAAHPYADTTKHTYRNVIPRVLALLNEPASATAAELIQAVQATGWGNARQCLALHATRKYLTWTYGNKHPARHAKLKRIQGKLQRTVTPKLMLDLMATFNRYTPKGARDLALCSLMLDTGLRESEICNIQLADVDLDRRTLQVIVKGGQWESAIFSSETAAHIEHWLKLRVIQDGKNALFTSTRQRIGKPISPRGLQSIVREWGKFLGVPLSPHDFRRGMAVTAAMGGASELLIMLNGRWKSTDMVRRYTRGLRLEAMRDYLPLEKLENLR